MADEGGTSANALLSSVRTGTVWEREYAYSRAVRHGRLIEVAGTTAPGDDAYVQAKAIFAKVTVLWSTGTSECLMPCQSLLGKPAADKQTKK